jgi:hypothetical protein
MPCRQRTEWVCPLGWLACGEVSVVETWNQIATTNPAEHLPRPHIQSKFAQATLKTILSDVSR